MIEISVDPHELIAAMNGMERQLPFATARALNETAVAFQLDERQVLRREFTIRRPWVEQGIKINRGDFATKAKLSVVIGVDPTRDFLSKFERGGVRSPRAGGKALAVPADIRAAKSAIIPTNKRPKAFDFREVGGAKLVAHARKLHGRKIRAGVLGGSLRVFVGKQRTILIQGGNGGGVILQRMPGRGKTLKVLYRLRPKTDVPADLHFVETAQKSFRTHWPQAFTKWWNESVRTAHTGAPIAQGMVLPAGFSE